MESFMPTGAIAIAARLSIAGDDTGNIDRRQSSRSVGRQLDLSSGTCTTPYCSPQKRPLGHDCACITPIHPIGVQACYLLNSVPVQVGLPTPLPAYSPDTGLPYPGCYLVAVIFFTTENFP